MGQVYRATDKKLKRQVAIKILPPSLKADHDRLARFQREAEVLASLNHPNIAAIYGLEESGGVSALVMELIEGDDLSQRIARGAIPLDEALPIAKQIADALEAAHEQGIIHRDLKPANIKLRSDGTVKVLDFGLAKALEPASAASANVTASPTITSPAMMTGVGVILGTAAYMSPEQAKGRPADRRSDIWSFGCVLYEMLSGARPFGGEDVAETLACILTKEPDWSALPDSVPVGIRTLLQRCLTKDRKRRLDSAAAARLEFDDALTRPVPGATTVQEDQRRHTSQTVASIALLAGGVLAGWFTAVWFSAAPASSPPVARLLANVSPAERLLGVTPDERRFLPNRPSRWAVAWAPDGSRFVFTAIRGDTQQLYLRSLGDGLDAEPIPGTENSDTPFFSPDGQWLGFWRDNELRKMPASGGPSVRICATPPIFGESWGSNNVVVFGSEQARGLMRVSADGGTPQELTTAKDSGDNDHRFPHVLPGGKGVLFTAMRLVKDRILCVWEQRRAEAMDRTTERQRRVSAIQQKLDKLDEAFLYAEAIDVTTYGRQRDKLREELTLAKIDHHSEAVEELDVEGILAFAERILPRASDLWVQASLDYKQRLQQLFFPEGIAYDGNRFNRTALTAPLFKYLAPSESADEKMVSRLGIEPRT